MRITTKGQVTIPQAIREQLGLLPHTEVEFDIVGDSVRIRKTRGRTSRGDAVVAGLRGTGRSRLTTDQIMALTRGEQWRRIVRANVLLDVAREDAEWLDWSASMLAQAAEQGPLVINALVYAEVSIAYDSVESLDGALPAHYFSREDLPWDAAFLAGKLFVQYRRRGGTRRSPLPDFYIGAHATVRGQTLLTRDARRYRHYFPRLRLVSP